MTIQLIVEGEGEEAATRVLLERLVSAAEAWTVRIARPIDGAGRISAARKRCRGRSESRDARPTAPRFSSCSMQTMTVPRSGLRSWSNGLAKRRRAFPALSSWRIEHTRLGSWRAWSRYGERPGFGRMPVRIRIRKPRGTPRAKCSAKCVAAIPLARIIHE